MERDTFAFGIIIGIILPLVAYPLLLLINVGLEASGMTNGNGSPIQFREQTLAIIAICMNLIPFQKFKNLRFDNAMRGMVIPTLAFVFIWVWMFDIFKF